VGARTSVVIPCYNGEPYLQEALASVAGQTRPAREIIVIDDGSRVPVRAPGNWPGPPLRIERTPNRGLPAARNFGIRLATGQFVAFLDADDAWASNKLAAQEDLLAAQPGAVAAFVRKTARPGWEPVPYIQYPDPSASTDQFTMMLWKRNFIAPSAVLVRRDAILAIGGFDEQQRYLEDWECWFRLLARGAWVQVPLGLCYYRMHPGQMTKHSYAMAEYCRMARRKVIALHGMRLEAAGITAREQDEAVRKEYRARALVSYYRREGGSARLLLWRYIMRHPTDVMAIKYGLFSLVPASLLAMLRGRTVDQVRPSVDA
jgi:glycosyltransferase involved in cell wall biosynthesis